MLARSNSNMFSSWALCNTNHNHVNSNDENTNDDVVIFCRPSLLRLTVAWVKIVMSMHLLHRALLFAMLPGNAVIIVLASSIELIVIAVVRVNIWCWRTRVPMNFRPGHLAIPITIVAMAMVVTLIMLSLMLRYCDCIFCRCRPCD